MKKLYRHKAMIAVSLVVLGWVAVLLSPLGFTPAAFVIMAAIAVPVVMFMLRTPSPTTAEMLNAVDSPPRAER